MTKSLTEKWKDGELGFGYYYIDFGVGGVPMLFNGLEFYCERTQKPNAIKTILAPVPSYDEYKELVRKIDESDEELKNLACKNDTLAMENGKLQERLADADKALKAMDEKYGEHYAIADGTKMGNSPAWKYMLKWGVK